MAKFRFTLCALLCAVSASALIPTRTVEVEVSEATSYPISVMQGETYEWRFRYLQDGATLSLAGADSATMTWTAYGTAYVATGTVHSATGGVASIVWTSDNATPKGSYQYAVAVASNTVVLARARGTLTVSQGVSDGGAIPVWLGATKADVTNIVAAAISAIPEPVESDPSAYPVATNALAVAQAALPQSATNGWEVGSHAGMATTGQVASAIGTATNLADVAATAALGSMMTTGRIYRAEAARMLEASNGRAWLEFGTNGAVYVVSVTNTTSVYVTETSGEGYNGPAAGSVFVRDEVEDPYAWFYGTWKLYSDGVNGWSLEIPPSPAAVFDNTGQALPATMFAPEGNGGVGAPTIDWLPATNVYIIATEPTVISISQNAVDAHNADGDAHPTLARAADVPSFGQATNIAQAVVSATIPGAGCTLLSGVAPTVTGATVNYLFAPTNAYTLVVATNAPRYNYSVAIQGTNACTFGTGVSLVGTWTPSGTNLVVLAPCTGTVWRAYGRAY